MANESILCYKALLDRVSGVGNGITSFGGVEVGDRMSAPSNLPAVEVLRGLPKRVWQHMPNHWRYEIPISVRIRTNARKGDYWFTGLIDTSSGATAGSSIVLTVNNITFPAVVIPAGGATQAQLQNLLLDIVNGGNTSGYGPFTKNATLDAIATVVPSSGQVLIEGANSVSLTACSLAAPYDTTVTYTITDGLMWVEEKIMDVIEGGTSGDGLNDVDQYWSDAPTIDATYYSRNAPAGYIESQFKLTLYSLYFQSGTQ